ncbi:hypothetical protein IQ255_27820 [Pleurocapsales cyanobacterium LEGE 10410]|nr:hypothetical protein [Pleurocapsales cyanobacterium LEGE 10410]
MATIREFYSHIPRHHWSRASFTISFKPGRLAVAPLTTSEKIFIVFG